VYVYCIVDGRAAPRLPSGGGVPGSRGTRAVAIDTDRWLVAADVPRARVDETALAAGMQDLDWLGACALAHDALIVELMKSGAVVPMRLFTMFEDESRAVAHARAAAARISRTLRRVAGRAEYGVRIGLAPAARRPPALPRAASGRSFLEHKRDQLAARRRRVLPPEEERRRVVERLSRASDDARRRPIPDGASSVWLDGAFLVPLESARTFRKEVERLSRELRDSGHEVVLTGPWPPYSFLDEHAGRS
jgi:hypothetical protein